MLKIISVLVLAALSVPACAQEDTPPAKEFRVAPIINKNNVEIGTVQITKAPKGVLIFIDVSGISPGLHGMHFHKKGTCEDHDMGFKETGGHIMPTNLPHGFLNPNGPHEGNLPNLVVNEDGKARVELYSNLVSYEDGSAAVFDFDGSTLIIHENTDDHYTQPIGGAGNRVACAVLKK